jgi:predicted O-methyltransferase YrrM
MGRIFEHAQQYLGQLDPGEFVEIGTSRGGDDGSTKTLAGWCDRLITVDVDPINCDFARSLELSNVEVVWSKGEDYLRTRIYGMRPIGLLYLDNFDWDWHPESTEDFVREQQERYTELGMHMTNVNSQSSHLAQMILALPHMAQRCLVVCDDTWYNKWWGQYAGKSGAVVPFLLSNGFEVLYTEEQPVYGTILGRGIAK